jgi:Photosynthesis system II assembly factor YCF48/Putative zinc-finger
MNYELPKPIREALARQMAHDAHPSADVLTAFAEHGLRHDERQRVIDHLAQCTECRDVVFLASNAVEEAVGEEQKLVAAAAARPLTPAVLAKPMAAQARASAGDVAEPRPRAWRHWWVWGPAVAVVLVVAGVVIEKRSEFGLGTITVASKEAPELATPSEHMPAIAPAPEAQIQPNPESKAKPSPGKPVTKSLGTTAAPAGSSGTLAANKMERKALEESQASGIPASPANPSMSARLDIPLEAAKPAPLTPTQNSFAGNEGRNNAMLYARPQALMHLSVNSSRMWRVTPDGHLEHSTAPGSWTLMLADQPTTFHVVSVVGNNVWAGGSSGVLFHSSDSGETWSKQPLAGETGTIVSINFSDAAHGIITTDGGARWSTSDGGVTWTKE